MKLYLRPFFHRGLVALVLAHCVYYFVHATVSNNDETEPTHEIGNNNDIFHKRRRPHINTPNMKVIKSMTIPSNNTVQCKSIIAIGKTTVWSDDESRSTDRSQRTGEDFVCERYDASDIPIQGTYQQLQILRKFLNNGTLISAESTVEVYQKDFTKSITHPDQTYAPNGVVLPPGDVKLIQPQIRRQQRLSYEGQKLVLAVRVIDRDGLAIGDDAKTISDKIFGTYGDSATMTSQYAACSFNKLQITWQSTRAVQKILAAPGVLEVNIGISIRNSDQGSIRGAVYEAAGRKLGFMLPGAFEHVMFVLEGCYKDCGWAAYAYVNSWLSVYQGPFYKFPGVQMHEIGHNLNFAHSGGIGEETYTDHTCLMGNPLYSDSIVKMCYNQAKNFQLAQAGAWFDKNHAITLDFDPRGGFRWSGRIVGAAEYEFNSAGHPIVVKLHTGTSRDLFIGFNRAVGQNADNQQASDAITITEAGSGIGYSQSFIQALLATGHDKSFLNWKGSLHTLTVTVNKIDASVRPGYGDITITCGPQTKSPSKNPTRQPSSSPSLLDSSHYPTLSLPTYIPTFMPTGTESSSLQTSNTNYLNKSVKGLMFTLKAKKHINIRAFNLYARRNTMSAVTIYTKLGDYQVESHRYGWNEVYQRDVQLSRATTNLEQLDINLAAGSTHSFFIYIDAGMRIKTTANAGQPHGQDDAMVIYSGTAFRREFYNIVGFGQFAGEITYEVA